MQFANSIENVLTCINNSLYIHETLKFHHDKAFESAMVDKFEITSCKYFIYQDCWQGLIVGYASLGNGWIAILILSGMLESCNNSSGKAAIFQIPSPRWKVNHKNSLKKTLDRDPPFLKCFTVKVSRLPIDPQNPRNFSTLNNLQHTVWYEPDKHIIQLSLSIL